MTKSVLVADIGGTHARFAIAVLNHGEIALRDIRSFPSKEFGSVSDAANAYLKSIKTRPDGGCFAVAAPVEQAEIIFTNSSWRFRRDELQSSLGLKQFHVVNDFHGQATGVEHLPEKAFELIKSGTGDPSAPVLVMGPGTGLGQALIIPTSNGPFIVSTQGGHVGFAPSTDEEVEIMKIVARVHPRVSVERLLSGEGLVNIYHAVCAMTDAEQQLSRPAEITAAARAGTSGAAAKAIELFCEILGRTVGDAVLSTGARGGVVLGGGVLPKIRDIFVKSKFTECFMDKGRMRHYVGDVSIKLIIKGEAALLGAAHIINNALDDVGNNK